MRKINLILFIVLTFLIILIIQIFKIDNRDVAFAAGNNGSTSDVQLIARAINGEARGEPYEGQVAVRSGNIK